MQDFEVWTCFQDYSLKMRKFHKYTLSRSRTNVTLKLNFQKFPLTLSIFNKYNKIINGFFPLKFLFSSVFGGKMDFIIKRVFVVVVVEWIKIPLKTYESSNIFGILSLIYLCVNLVFYPKFISHFSPIY